MKNFEDRLSLKGTFKALAYNKNKDIIYSFEAPNKILPGARYLIPRIFAPKLGEKTPYSEDHGISKFCIFGIDRSIEDPDCTEQMLQGNFGNYYDDLEITSIDELTTDIFPCLNLDDTIETNHWPSTNCSNLTDPSFNQSSLTCTPKTNSLFLCMKIGTGFVSEGENKYYSLAALLGKSSENDDDTEYIYAIEQFPVMIKTRTVTFEYSWELFF